MVRLLAAIAACFFLLPSAAVAAAREPVPPPPSDNAWLAVHRETGLWSGTSESAELFGIALPGRRFQVALPQDGSRLYVWDPISKNYTFVDAFDVGPTAAPRAEDLVRPVVAKDDVIPAENFIWRGTARVTMYTCVELGGCNATASGIWPYEGVVAVDPRLIPLGSSVWLDGLGIFLAADTGSLVRGYHVDVYVNDYSRARRWGLQYLEAAAFIPPR
jgi:3D (Asp-Asp-Asp) domain-containing protein